MTFCNQHIFYLISHIDLILFLFACFFAISWLIPKPYMNKKEGNKEGQIVKEKKDRRSADGKISQLEVETKVDGKEDGEEELHFHTTVSWDQPRR